MPTELSRHDEYALLQLNRPDALNALSFAVLDEISARIDEVGQWPVRGLVITGGGDKAFCAGADIKELRDLSSGAHRRGVEKGQAVFSKLGSLPFPTAAAINGYAFGGGLELALACNFRVAVASAKLGLPEVKLGLIPGYGGTQRLPRVVGEARALEIIMSGRTLDANEAERIGLVHRIVAEDPVGGAAELLRSMTGYSLATLMLASAAVTRALDVPVQEGLRIEADLSTLAYGTADAAEGMAAFAEKRKADFKDA